MKARADLPSAAQGSSHRKRKVWVCRLNSTLMHPPPKPSAMDHLDPRRLIQISAALVRKVVVGHMST